jgi:putative hydrolase
MDLATVLLRCTVVSPGPDDPYGENDPFKGMPLFGDLAKMFQQLQQQGPVSWDAGRQLALSIATDGQPEANVDPIERIRIEELARVAELQVAGRTGLDTSVGGHGIRFVPVTRGEWARRTLDAYRPLFEALAGSLKNDAPTTSEPSLSGDPLAWMAPLMEMIGPMMLGMTAGSMVGHLAQRALGQYDLPIPRPASDELIVVPANLDAFGAAWSLPLDDLRLWVCLHDVTHHAVLGVPHVRERITSLLHGYLAGFDTSASPLEDRLNELELHDPSSMPDLESLFGDPQALLGAIQTPEQHAILPQIQAVVAVIVGYVDHVMDAIGTSLLQSYPMLTEALRRRRVEAAPSDASVVRLFGLELTQAQYDRGEAFIDGVVEREGDVGLGRLWESERNLPTPAEVDAPGLWLARIDLPDA